MFQRLFQNYHEYIFYHDVNFVYKFKSKFKNVIVWEQQARKMCVCENKDKVVKQLLYLDALGNKKNLRRLGGKHPSKKLIVDILQTQVIEPFFFVFSWVQEEQHKQFQPPMTFCLSQQLSWSQQFFVIFWKEFYGMSITPFLSLHTYFQKCFWKKNIAYNGFLRSWHSARKLEHKYWQHPNTKSCRRSWHKWCWEILSTSICKNL